MDLREAVGELYGAPLGDFVAVRGRLVARARDEAPELVAELKALRKPTVAAWLLNRVARQEPQVVGDLLELGSRMREAQAKGDGAALAAVRPERRAAIEGLVAAARRVASGTGTSFTAGTADEVGATGVAVLADPASGEALASGRLLRPLAYAGFGEVELEDAVAALHLVPPLPDGHEEPSDTAKDHDCDSSDECDTCADAARRAAEDERHEREVRAAEDVLREHERALSAAELRFSEARAAMEAVAEEVEQCRAEVRSAADELARIETRRTVRRA